MGRSWREWCLSCVGARDVLFPRKKQYLQQLRIMPGIPSTLNMGLLQQKRPSHSCEFTLDKVTWPQWAARPRQNSSLLSLKFQISENKEAREHCSTITINMFIMPEVQLKKWLNRVLLKLLPAQPKADEAHLKKRTHNKNISLSGLKRYRTLSKWKQDL